MTHTAKPAAVSPTATPDASASQFPSCEFRIGEGHAPAHLGQFPNLRLLTLSAIGKAPMELPDGAVDTLGLGPVSLGVLIGDAYLKLLRTRGQQDQGLHCDVEPLSHISSVIDLMLPLSPRAWATRETFLRRVNEFGKIALLHPGRLPAIIANVDALTNARLTERARAIVTTGIDPGADDLWLSETSDDVGV